MDRKVIAIRKWKEIGKRMERESNGNGKKIKNRMESDKKWMGREWKENRKDKLYIYLVYLF